MQKLSLLYFNNNSCKNSYFKCIIFKKIILFEIKTNRFNICIQI